MPPVLGNSRRKEQSFSHLSSSKPHLQFLLHHHLNFTLYVKKTHLHIHPSLQKEMETLRSTLLPLTRNLPPPLNSAALSLLGPSCHAALVLNLQPTQQCLSLLASKLLGVAIIAASPLVKLDQIRKLLLARSAAGLSLLSCALETLAFGVGLAYNARQGHPFSTYGETALIAAQNVVIGVLVLTYRGRRGAVVGGVLAGLGALGWAVGDERVVGDGSLRVLQVGAGVVGVLAKAPQIWTVWREGGTGQLSAFAVSGHVFVLWALILVFLSLRFSFEVRKPLPTLIC